MPTALLDVPAGAVDKALARVADWDGPGYRPGEGSTRQLWELLATTAAHDLGIARAIEPVLDARAILAQANHPPLPSHLSPASSWGVFAAEGPVAPLEAHQDGEEWVLDGVKPWCSLAGLLDGALVTARTADGGRRLFAVELADPRVTQMSEPWTARGLAEIPSTPVRFDAVAAFPVGEAGWYLSRPGFWWGGIGVAACWYGGSVGVSRRVLEKARSSANGANEGLQGALGQLDERLADARRALAEAAILVDAAVAAPVATAAETWRLLAMRVRATVARCCEDVLRIAADALGPAPLAQEERHAKRVADLALYIRQHSAWREAVSLGGLIVEPGRDPW